MNFIAECWVHLLFLKVLDLPFPHMASLIPKLIVHL
jgi:hypothetical protein